VSPRLYTRSLVQWSRLSKSSGSALPLTCSIGNTSTPTSLDERTRTEQWLQGVYQPGAASDRQRPTAKLDVLSLVLDPQTGEVGKATRSQRRDGGSDGRCKKAERVAPGDGGPRKYEEFLTGAGTWCSDVDERLSGCFGS
jgi:hypothetical protein